MRNNRDPYIPAWLSMTLFLFVSAGLVAYFVYTVGVTLLVSFDAAFVNLLP
jgi:hypothetical protein